MLERRRRKEQQFEYKRMLDRQNISTTPDGRRRPTKDITPHIQTSL